MTAAQKAGQTAGMNARAPVYESMATERNGRCAALSANHLGSWFPLSLFPVLPRLLFSCPMKKLCGRHFQTGWKAPLKAPVPV